MSILAAPAKGVARRVEWILLRGHELCSLALGQPSELHHLERCHVAH
jgi:hypothetical protein